LHGNNAKSKRGFFMQADEKLIKLSKVPPYVEQLTGERPHIATIHRWHLRGCRGVKLQTAFAGGHRRTTEKWVRQFFEAVTAAANGSQVAEPMPTTAGHDKADRELSAIGI
jgi:hypothetical protein